MRWKYRCTQCHEEYEIEKDLYLCPLCSKKNKLASSLNGVLECVFDRDEWEKSKQSDFDVLFPVEEKYFPKIRVGNTPLWSIEALRKQLGFENLFFKDDTCEPSGSYKDRASYLVAAFAIKNKIKEIALASTGNAASSMSCIGAASGLDITVFLPKKAPIAKRIQVLQYGARLNEIDGNYDLAFDKCLEYCNEKKVLCRNTAYNPLTIEGKKSSAFEIARDIYLQSKLEAEHIFIPTGDGVIFAGLARGFENLYELGLIKQIPKLWLVQAEGSSAIHRAFKSGSFDVKSSNTIADSISVDAPRNGLYALELLKKHNGDTVIVSDKEIMEAQLLSSSKSGLFVEPSSAAAFAGFLKIKNNLGKKENIVIMMTGSGLKDISSAGLALGLD